MSSGGRIAEHLSVGILARSYPRERIRDILERMGLQSQRVRDLPAEALVYYVIGLGLFMAVSTGEVLRSLVEGLQWLEGKSEGLKPASKSAISQARSRLGAAPLRALWEESATPVAVAGQPGAFYQGLRLVSIDGSTLDVPDTAQNLAHFGRQESSRGQSAFPQLRFVALCESGSHTIFWLRMGSYPTHETTLAAQLLPDLRPCMLCLADRLSFTHAIRVIRRNLAAMPAFPPREVELWMNRLIEEILQDRLPPRKGRYGPCGGKRKMSGYPIRRSRGPTKFREAKPIHRKLSKGTVFWLTRVCPAMELRGGSA